MFTRSRRLIRPEILDEQTPEAAAASLRDLVRINRWLGGHEALRSALRGVAPEGPFTVLDVGAASGDSGRVIRQAYPQAVVTSLDYRAHHMFGAPAPKVVADAFQPPFGPGSFDIVHCSLFLHHFEDPAVVNLLRGFGAMARVAVVVNDLERHALAYWFLPWTRWLLGWDAITVHDGPISVQAAFMEEELRALAQAAGLREIRTRMRRPAFRITLVARP
ncbi:MAG TPA: methyltransferase domain-containing protein [Bryobacteraceae bacterium]|nr:methyltransferase domain-containing protein [Bryobacteraceae bacterium]